MYRVLMCVFNPHMYNEMQFAFMEAGCDVKNIGIGDEFTGKMDLLRKLLISVIDEFKPHFVYSYGWWKDIVDINEFLDVIRHKGVFNVWWSADDPICFGTVSLPAARGSDMVFTPVDEQIYEYSRYGIKAWLQPNGCSPRYVRSSPREEYRNDIVLLANNYNLRCVSEDTRNSIFYRFRLDGIKNVLEPLVENNINVGVWGRWWTDCDRAYILSDKFYKGILPADAVPGVYASCRIALGIQQVGTSRTFLSVRTYEALGCGAFHLTQYSPAAENFFKKGIHLEWSQSKEETLQLVNYYLSHSDEMEKIALAGQQEVEKNHKLVHRARSVLDVIRSNSLI